jgi:hypothetical protein
MTELDLRRSIGAAPERGAACAAKLDRAWIAQMPSRRVTMYSER